MINNENEIKNEIIEGRNAVTEALRAGRNIDKIFIAKGETDSSLKFIASKAKSMGIVVADADKRKLDFMSVTKAHQGVIAVVAAGSYIEFNELLPYLKEKANPMVVICDEISDPHNLGAIIRSSHCFGADAVIIPKRRSSGLTAVVSKASAGAVEYIPVCRVSNLSSAIKELKAAGFWVYGTSAKADRNVAKTDFSGSVALVIGSEGEGMGRLIEDSCDFLISIPMSGQIDSLNASCAAAVVMYEIHKQRTNL